MSNIYRILKFQIEVIDAKKYRAPLDDCLLFASKVLIEFYFVKIKYFYIFINHFIGFKGCFVVYFREKYSFL